MLFKSKANMSQAFKSHPVPLDPSESLSEGGYFLSSIISVLKEFLVSMRRFLAPCERCILLLFHKANINFLSKQLLFKLSLRGEPQSDGFLNYVFQRRQNFFIAGPQWAIRHGTVFKITGLRVSSSSHFETQKLGDPEQVTQLL